MSISCFLKLKGPKGAVKGESKQSKHEGQIEIFSWNWDVQNAANNTGCGSGKGKGTPGMLILSKKFDSASPVVAKGCADGTHFEEAVLDMTKASGPDDQQAVFLTVTLKEAFISGVRINASQTGDVFEDVILSYKDIEFNYKPQDAKGGMGGDIKFGWDVIAQATR